MIQGYIVEYLRYGVEESFITKDRNRAEQYAAQHNGVITPLIKWLETDSNVKPSQPLCTIGEAGCSLQEQTAT